MPERFVHVVGARPNLIKMAPLYQALQGCSQVVVHTGQHYHPALRDELFEQLELPAPDIALQIGSGSYAQQVARGLLELDTVLRGYPEHTVIVYGDVNSTLAAALAATSLGLPLAHVEAGLRCFDKSMPEERNRRLVGCLAEWNFAPSQDACEHLLKEGIAAARIHLVGNIMVDTARRWLPVARARPPLPGVPPEYLLVTLHRPENVDDPARLRAILGVLDELHLELPVIFPIHPRTHSRLKADNVSTRSLLLEPLGYLDFLKLQAEARLVITDSGGVQEEAVVLGVACLTLRQSTERPITLGYGNRLIRHLDELSSAVRQTLAEPTAGRGVPPLWDGATAPRIAEILRGCERVGQCGPHDVRG